MQQQSKSPQSMHFVLPGVTPAGFVIEDAAEEGRTKRTGETMLDDAEWLHMAL